jgi:hypothetical protein
MAGKQMNKRHPGIAIGPGHGHPGLHKRMSIQPDCINIRTENARILGAVASPVRGAKDRR